MKFWRVFALIVLLTILIWIAAFVPAYSVHGTRGSWPTRLAANNTIAGPYRTLTAT